MRLRRGPTPPADVPSQEELRARAQARAVYSNIGAMMRALERGAFDYEHPTGVFPRSTCCPAGNNNHKWIARPARATPKARITYLLCVVSVSSCPRDYLQAPLEELRQDYDVTEVNVGPCGCTTFAVRLRQRKNFWE